MTHRPSSQTSVNLVSKLETYFSPSLPGTYGFDSPIEISEGPYGPTQLQDQSIKAADLSVVPVNVAANTVNLVFAIWEKAANIFARSLNFSV